MVRLYPDWMPANPELPKTVVVKIANLNTAKSFTDNAMFDDMFKGSDANVSDMLEAMSLMQKPVSTKCRFRKEYSKTNK